MSGPCIQLLGLYLLGGVCGAVAHVSYYWYDAQGTI